MQANPVHEFVHDESCAGHVAAVFHDGDEKVQDHAVGEEHQHAANAGNDAVHYKVLEPAVGHESAHQLAEFGH